MVSNDWTKIVLWPLGAIVSVVTVLYSIVDQIPFSCGLGLFGLNEKQTTTAIVSIAFVGWICFFTLLKVSSLIPWRARLKRTLLTEDSVIKEVKKAKVLRVFASGSNSARSLIHSRISTITHNMEIKVLIRTDGSPEREAILAKEISRWRRDIQKGNIELSIVKYSFDPVMFRGWIIDESVAIIGWYCRHEGATLGQADVAFRINDKDFVKQLIVIFDRLFIKGERA